MSDAAWAASLQPLLAVLQPREIRLLPDTPAGVGAEWREADSPDGSGWLLRLVRNNRNGPALFVSSLSRTGVSERDAQVAAAVGRLAWQLRGKPAEFAPADALDEAVHALHNALNGALMNTAVLTMRAASSSDHVREVAERVEDATLRSVQELHRLVALIEPLR